MVAHSTRELPWIGQSALLPLASDSQPGLSIPALAGWLLCLLRRLQARRNGLVRKGSRFRLFVCDDVERSQIEEHTSELQSRQYLVCRLLLEKKNTHALRTSL